jgi:hypothetical protein
MEVDVDVHVNEVGVEHPSRPALLSETERSDLRIRARAWTTWSALVR